MTFCAPHIFSQIKSMLFFSLFSKAVQTLVTAVPQVQLDTLFWRLTHFCTPVFSFTPLLPAPAKPKAIPLLF